MGFVNTGGLFKNLTIDAEISPTSENAVQNKAVALALEGKARSVDLTSHINNTISHISAEERTAWNAKQNVLSTGNATTAGITKLYSSTGTNTDGAITQNALTTVLGTKSAKSIITNVTLASGSWVGSSAPYTYTLSVTGVTADNEVEVLPNYTGMTIAQAAALTTAFENAQISKYIPQATNSITLYSYGIKPTSNMPMTVIIRG